MLFGLSTKSISAALVAVALVGVVIGTAAVLADDGDFGTIQAPEWKSGYAWTYDITGDFEYSVSVPGEGAMSDGMSFGPFQVKKEILNTEDFAVRGDALYVGATTLPIGHILEGMVFDYMDGGWANLEMYPTADRQRDLAPVPVWPTSEQGRITGLSFGDPMFIPQDYIQFPLEYGNRWTDSVEFDELVMAEDELAELSGITEIKMVGEAGKMQTISLPIGATKAVRIDYSYQPVGLQKAVAQVREEAEAYGVNVERLTVQMGLHEIAHYSPEYQAVVRDQFVLSALVDAVFSFQGDRVEFFSEFSAYTVAELTGAKLDAEPDRTMEEIIAKLEGREPIKDATGQSVDPKSLYRVNLDASATRVNAAEGESVLFQVDTDREGGMPTGHTLEYVVKDFDGAIVERGPAASSFNLAFSDPGAYVVAVAALNQDGALVSQDKVSIAADYAKRTAASCSVTATISSYDCGTANVPVRAGAVGAVLEAKVNQTLPASNMDRLQFDAGDGRTWFAYDQGNGLYRIELDEDDLDVSKRDGELHFVPVVGAGSDLVYDVTVNYRASPTGAQLYGAEAGGLLLTHDVRAIGALMGPVDAALQQVIAGQTPADALGFEGIW